MQIIPFLATLYLSPLYVRHFVAKRTLIANFGAIVSHQLRVLKNYDMNRNRLDYRV